MIEVCHTCHLNIYNSEKNIVINHLITKKKSYSLKLVSREVLIEGKETPVGLTV